MAEFEEKGAIRPLPRTRREKAIADLAGRQHGVVARSQLRALGLSDAAIKRRVTQRRIFRLFPATYALGRPDVPFEGRWMAAVLSAGPGALLSHRSAACLWDLIRADGRNTDVTAPGRRRLSVRGVRLHQPVSIPPRHRSTCRGIPVTEVHRTLLDLAADPGEPHLPRAFDQAERLELLDMRELHRVVDQNRGRRGIRTLRAVVSGATDPPDVRSELEARFLDLCRRFHLPLPAMNCVVAGHVVDAHWPGTRLVVELDGFAWHWTRRAFERDRRRDSDLLRAGFEVLRITARRLEEEGDRDRCPAYT
jgi:hypothetical protein